MMGAETKENGHISHSTISLNSKKKREKVHTQIKEPTILLQVRKACHTSSNKAIAQQCRKKHVELKLSIQYYQLKPACCGCVHQHTEGQKSGTNIVHLHHSNNQFQS
jgi:hypothetical protein